MPGVRYSVRAERDLTMIAEYTLSRWGKDQAVRYLDDLEACCQQLAASPALGRACDGVRQGLRRMENAFRVLAIEDDMLPALISRILHHSVLPEQQPVG